MGYIIPKYKLEKWLLEKWSYTILLLGVVCYGCTYTEEANEKRIKQELSKKLHRQDKNEVDIMVLQKGFFRKELLSNGKLIASQKSILKFKVDGSLKKLLVQNGDVVGEGQALASLDAFKYEQTLSSAKISFGKASLEFEDMLVGRGYDLNNKEQIPDNIYDMATIRSGYAEAENQLINARFDVNSAVLRAPFDGKVADIQFKEYEHVNSGVEFLTLIDDKNFEVEFYLIESEINQITKGELVEVLAFNSQEVYKGKVNSINPVVEKNGMVRVKALVKNNGELLDGMNVKIRIQKEMADKLVVPKETVILRQNQEVLFKYQNGKAFWTYVQTIHENSDSYAVIAHPDKSNATLIPGDTVIVRGNLNLAHDSKVVIKN